MSKLRPKRASCWCFTITSACKYPHPTRTQFLSMFKTCLLANRTCVHTYGQVRARSVWNTDRRVLFCGEMLANRPHYLLQVVTMIWDMIWGYISISISTLVYGISVNGTIYQIGCEDTERKCEFSYHIRNGTKLLTHNIVMHIILYNLHVFQ